MIEVQGLTKRFGNTSVLNGIDLEIADGERIVVIGPSGTGKSTLLRCLNFLDRPEAGRIRIGDLELDAATAGKSDILALRCRTPANDADCHPRDAVRSRDRGSCDLHGWRSYR